MAVPFPELASDLIERCTRELLARMLRQRRYRLEITTYKKDKGLHKVYMYDPWAEPMMIKIGEYYEGDEPDWEAMYDAAMALHLERKANRSRYGE
ncbi:hypothetical protein [Roseomonas rosulenta]|uniref:hypothetical protein n=1 Tax=Roseomonas rosulenta TaxID=2748667 RepID=UPI0018DFA1BE|nr:hypothetical protein [Roseomonas rosulenta]